MNCKRVAITIVLLLSLLVESSWASDCTSEPGLNTLYSTSWGIDYQNTRFQPRSTLSTANAGTLKLKWAYGLANNKPRSYPLVTEDTIFIGDTGHGLVALDRETGCTRWHLPLDGEIASAIVPEQRGDKTLLFLTLRTGGLVVVDASSGQEQWRTEVTDEAVPFYSGTPVVANGMVYLPLSSLEIGLTLNPLYGCCTTSGGMVGLDASDGTKQWYRPTIEEEPQQTGRRALFIEEWGPSGAPVWGPPTYDLNRGTLYFGTGQNYSHPTTDTSDAIFAISTADGEVKWVRQFTEQDAFNMACSVANHPNCPDPMGPDLDFGAPPILARLRNGSEVLLAGQKSGDVYAMKPESGEVLWSQKLGRGGMLGGVHWSMAYQPDRELLLVPISDISTGRSKEQAQSGMHALNARNGEIRWQHLREGRCPERRCSPGLSAAIIVNHDIAVAGSLDGFIEVYSLQDGKVLWSLDTWTEFDTVNGVTAKGGAIDAHGPMLAGNQLIINSGYGSFGTRGGNVLLVFEVAEDAP